MMFLRRDASAAVPSISRQGVCQRETDETCESSMLDLIDEIDAIAAESY